MPPPPIRFPAARMFICFMLTPASPSAPRAASDARSTESLSGCLPNFVMWMPRIQTSSLIAVLSDQAVSSGRFEAEANGLGPRFVGTEGERGEPELHSEAHVLWIGVGVDHVAAHARAVAVDHAGHERNRYPRGSQRDDREGLELALGRNVDVSEVLR